MRRILLIIIFAISFVNVFSNGGPIINSTITKTGHIQMMNVYGIDLVDEKINIKIEGEYSYYDIKYTFQREENNFYRNDTVTYGFPIDFMEDEYFTEDNFKNTNIPFFEMRFNGKLLETKEHIDFSFFNDFDVSNDSLSVPKDNPFNSTIKRKWFISQVIFDSHDTFELTVRYKVRNFSVDSATSKSTFINYDSRIMTYDFSPASFWGDGLIKNISINIDVRSLDSSFESHQIYKLDGFLLKDGIYSFTKTNFNPMKNKTLVLDYSFGTIGISRDILGNFVKMKFVKKIKASNLENINNINDVNFSTCYTTAKSANNKKTFIEYVFKDTVSFYYISILNGDFSNEANYYNNGRIKKIKIEYEVNEWETGKSVIKDTILVLKDRKYELINKDNLAHFVDIIELESFVSYGFVKRIKLIFLDNYPGKKNDNISISEFFINGILWSDGKQEE